MYLERIDTTAAAAASEVPSSKPIAFKLVAGLLFLLLCAVILVPWTLALACWVALTSGGKLVARSVACARDTLLYAGELTTGR